MKDRMIDILLDPMKIKGAVPPLMFGHFIEFMYDCINGGMYTQLLQSRGFEYPDSKGEGVSPPWRLTGYNDSYSATIDTEITYAPGQAQKLQVFTHYDGYCGIAQDGLLLEAQQPYSGYFWARSNDNVDIFVRVCNRAGEPLFCKHSSGAFSEWEKVSFEFELEKSCEEAMMEIGLESEGTIWLDQVSLMPVGVTCDIWTAVMERMRTLQIPALRFPGGCFADCYNWKDGIGPKDLRPSSLNTHWGGTEEHNFGTDEFIALCREVDCEPMICVNFGSATPEDAAAWVEYCNGDKDTEHGKLRALNGHPEPYDIKFWDIGNETFGEWEIGHCPAKEYAEKYMEFAQKMRSVDPDICLVACAGNGNSIDQNWNRDILPVISEQTNILGLHMYTPMIEQSNYDNTDIYYSVVGGAPKKSEHVLRETWKTVNSVVAHDHNIKLAVTEWNTSYHNNSLREQTLEAAISNAGTMNMFLRNVEILSMTNVSDLVNGWPGGLIRSKCGKAFGTPTYHTIALYATAGIKSVIQVEYDCEIFNTKQIGNNPAEKDIPYVDVVAGIRGDGKVTIFAVNRSLEKSVELRLHEQSLFGAIHTEIWSPNVSDRNAFGDEKIIPRKRNNEDKVIVLKPHSINRIELI